MGCVKTRTAPYYPVDNGQTEKANRSLLRAFISTVNNDISDQLIPHCLLAYRCTVYRILPCSLDVRSRTPNPLRFTVPTLTPDTTCSQRILKHQKRFYDRTAHGAPYQPENEVRLHQLYPNRGSYTKLDKPYSGPFVVVQSLPNNAYRFRPVSDPFADSLTVHFNRLKSGLEKTHNTGTEDLIPEADIPVHHTVEIPHRNPSPQFH
ncbi:unnamed protein product [Mesocestoides corti]|uniref:Integrase catalytic domain-containing protein n=1 Tax=Mesocestoides corti TaxID=53468 RepID=A0A0R3UQ54_MESCO|nr:unnamed protein product [Mesocestoides corti]